MPAATHPTPPQSCHQTLESWEQRVVQYGQDSLTSLTSLEERLARVGRENLQAR